MASPKNYERENSAESRRKPYVWMHTGMGPQVEVVKSSSFRGPDKWVVKIPAFPPHYRSEKIASDTNKQEARKKAVRWMENNPQGGQFTRA